MDVLGRVSHSFPHIPTGELEDEAVTPRMVRGEFGEIVDLASVGDPEGFGGVVYDYNAQDERELNSASSRRGWGMISSETALSEYRDGGLTFGHIDHTVDFVTSGHHGKRSKGAWW
jgi:hypothetical protein